MSVVIFREAASNAIRYFIAVLPASRSHLSVDGVLVLFILAVLANVAFCAAYPVDIFAQMSAFNIVWLRLRWVLLIVGILFAATITRFWGKGMFTRTP
jgi:hypothetical protein